MSRIGFAAGLLFVVAAPPVHADAFDHMREVTRVTTPHCRSDAGDDIVVCGRREADRYRLPFRALERGDPRGETVIGERERWQHLTTPCRELSIYLLGCGMAGVAVRRSFGVSGSTTRARALAD